MIAPALIFGVAGRVRRHRLPRLRVGVRDLARCITLHRDRRRAGDRGMIRPLGSGAAMLASWREVLRIGVPSILSNLIGPVSMAVVIGLLAAHGHAVVAGFGVAQRIESLALMVLMALGREHLAVRRAELGRGPLRRDRRGAACSAIDSRSRGVLDSRRVLDLFGRRSSAAINDHADVIDATYAYLVIVSLSYTVLGATFVAGSSFVALGKPLPSLVLTLSRMVLVYLPLAMLGNRLYGYKGIFGAGAIANVLAGAAGAMWVRRARTDAPTASDIRHREVARCLSRQPSGASMRLVAEMTLEEKVSMAAGSGLVVQHRCAAARRTGLQDVRRSERRARRSACANAQSAAFPVGVCLGATWNVDAHQRGRRRARGRMRSEGRAGAAGADDQPAAFAARRPQLRVLFGRPVSVGRVRGELIRAVQRRGVACCVKHFVCNDSEFERMTISSDVDERTLREVYLAPFERVVKDAQACGRSCLRTTGSTAIYASAHTKLLGDVLKGEWQFDGVVISDWGGTYDTVGPATAGLDLEMPGPARHMGEKLLAAVRRWLRRRSTRSTTRCAGICGC